MRLNIEFSTLQPIEEIRKQGGTHPFRDAKYAGANISIGCPTDINALSLCISLQDG
jgi:hypothetical protein